MSSQRRLIVHAASPAVETWVEGEVSDLIASRQYVRTVGALIEALGRGVAGEDDLVIVDLDRLSVEQVAELRAGIEARWWRGTLIGLGRQRNRHDRAFKIAYSIARPFGSEALRAILTGGSESDTQPNVAGPR